VRRDILLNGKRRWYFGKFFLGFSTNQLGNYSLTVTDLSISGCSSDPVAFTVEEIFPPTSITYTTEVGLLIAKRLL
jgi:hypothetical protein